MAALVLLCFTCCTIEHLLWKTAVFMNAKHFWSYSRSVFFCLFPEPTHTHSNTPKMLYLFKQRGVQYSNSSLGTLQEVTLLPLQNIVHNNLVYIFTCSYSSFSQSLPVCGGCILWLCAHCDTCSVFSRQFKNTITAADKSFSNTQRRAHISKIISSLLIHTYLSIGCTAYLCRVVGLRVGNRGGERTCTIGGTW